MALTSQSYEHSFFGTPTIDGLHKQSVFIDLGDHNGDSLLRGIAAGLLDKILKKQKVDHSVINELMTHYLAIFPEDRRISNKVNATERLQQLIQHTRPGKLIQKLAYTLGQIVAQEFSKNEEYAHLIVNGELTPTALTHDEGWGAITALATVLPELSLEFQIVEPNKPLFKRVSFNTTKQNPNSVVLQSQSGYYRPRLASSLFTSVVLLPVSELNRTVVGNVAPLYSHPEVVMVAPTEQERVVSMFEDMYRPLFAMVVAQELDVGALREIYAKSTTKSSENLFQRFHSGIFDRVVSTQSGLVGNNFSSDEQFAKYLVYSISKAVSFGQMDKEVVFSLVDTVQAAGIRAGR